jgi:hypothetical protein
MVREGNKDRRIRERPKGPGIFWARYAGSDGREQRSLGETSQTRARCTNRARPRSGLEPGSLR